jgi:hypothetical protein
MAARTASACGLSRSGPLNEPGPLDSMSCGEAPSAVAIEYPCARTKTFVSGSRTATLSAKALRRPSITSA